MEECLGNADGNINWGDNVVQLIGEKSNEA